MSNNSVEKQVYYVSTIMKLTPFCPKTVLVEAVDEKEAIKKAKREILKQKLSAIDVYDWGQFRVDKK